MAVAIGVVGAFAKTLIRRNAIKGLVASTKGMLTQAKVAEIYGHEDMHSLHDVEIEHIQVHIPKEEKFRIHITTGEGALKVNLEFVSNTMQKDLIEQLGPKVNVLANDEQFPIVRFNYLAEDIFINNLYMTFRKLGYNGRFTRYNNEKGIATFEVISHDDDEDTFLRQYSYYRSGLPNPC